MIAREGRAYAVRGARLLPWSFAGYGAAMAMDRGIEADVLTPPSTVAALARGYQPIWVDRAGSPP